MSDRLYQFACIINTLNLHGYIINLDKSIEYIEKSEGTIAVNYWITYKEGGGKNYKLTQVVDGKIGQLKLQRSIITGTNLKLSDFKDCIAE